MSKRGLKWSAVGVAFLLLVAVGATPVRPGRGAASRGR
jgi:hypothetical protein